MNAAIPDENVAMLSLVDADGRLEVSLQRQPMPRLGDDEVLVEVRAAPINPSDLFLLFAGADVEAVEASQRDGLPLLTGTVPQPALRGLAGRIGQAMPIGNEAGGVVVRAGAAPEAQALLGRTVAIFGGATYARYRALPAKMCLALPEGTDAEQGASCFVNPLTALGFVETVRRDGHKAIIHTAAASNLGQMLNRICIADRIPLVNVVRSEAQASLLREQGARYVLDSTAPDFFEGLQAAIAETGATVAFDATGGGKLGGRVVEAMEAVAVKRMARYDRYGSDVFKQLYIYGALDLSLTMFNRGALGFQWSISGWLLTHFMAKAGPDVVARMRARVVAELTTTFASHYSHRISLEQALDPQVIAAYSAKRTGDKYVIVP